MSNISLADELRIAQLQLADVQKKNGELLLLNDRITHIIGQQGEIIDTLRAQLAAAREPKTPEVRKKEKKI